ncbi:hypothetical protein [Actinomadura kijaniata]|uniref:hypothetical protein n=1 Tax=Actinomadura kijaniata TaxID=46161 RepID=UPI00082ED809|nr:hypothetical protein [Actinomadura kijaniata]
MSERVLGQCRRTWRRLGVPRVDIADMTAELAADLEAAERDGRDPQSYVGGDPAAFARAWASERGLVPVRALVGRVTLAAVLGGLPAGLAGLFVAYGLESATLVDATGGQADRDLSPWLFVAGYTLCAVFAWAGMVGGASAVLRFHGDAARRATVRALVWALPAAGLVAASVTIGLAARYGFPLGIRYFLAESLGPAAFLALVVAVVRWKVVGRRRGRPATDPWPAEN